ncbi:MAG: BMP family ABC transporter substrate-binding protein [Chloroflexi bacterium]|nr:BMP family ABC transporter substrate-binding protein [Chloroflexota bacterium]
MRSAANLILLTVVWLSLPGCLQSSDCFNQKVFCAALVTDTQGLDDHGINRDSWAGLEAAKDKGAIDRADFIESIDTRDYEKNIAYFAEKGYDAILTTGAGLQDETLQAAELYPDTVFIGMNQAREESRPNLIPVTFAEDQIGFVAGASAARISQTRIVGAVCETSGIDSMWRYCEGFRAGAKFVDENIIAQVIYRENGDRDKLFLDEAWGYETARQLIERGADVIFAAGGVTGQGALRAASEAGVDVIGAERDQRAALGESGSSVLTSIYGNASLEVQNLMRMLKDGNADEPLFSQIQYIPLDQSFPENYTKELDTLIFALLTGQIKTNVTFSRP